LLLLAAALLAAAAAPVEYAPLDPPVSLPDGSTFMTWSDRTRYTATLHVAAGHPRASDDNPGTEDRPLRTINRAAQLVKPGERVLIHSGVYREMVQPAAGGEGPGRMIAYEAAPGEQVIIKGSRVVETPWRRSRDPRGESERSTFSKKLWMTTLPASLFDAGYQPFRTPNATDYEIDLMPWALRWKGRIPYTLPRGLLYQDGRRLEQLATYEDLVRLPGSYWVAPDGVTLHVHPFGGGSPDGRLFEAAVQEHIFRPQRAGLGFIRVSGLIFEHCANGFLRVGIGAVTVMGGHHWIVERNTVRHVNSVGIEAGYVTFERQDKRFPRRTDPDIGHNIIRGNHIYDCGTAGIRGHTVSHGLVEYNDITDCGWQDAEFHWETAGIKLLINTGTLVRGNHVARTTGAGGIWLDWGNRNSRVTGNVMHDLSTVQGAFFVEASQEPNLIDHNIVWDVDGQGVRVADTDRLTVAHNLFMRVAEDLVYARVATDRSLGGRRLTSNGNRVVNNIFVDVRRPVVFGDPSNTADYNVYVTTREGAPAPKDAGPHTVVISGEVSIDAGQRVLTWRPAAPLPPAPRVTGCDRDFAGVTRTGDVTAPGPSLALVHGESHTFLTLKH
jgi:hypothetical protein